MKKSKHQKLHDFIARNETDIERISEFFSDNINDDDLLTQILKEGEDTELTFGQRLADKVASFGGSWTFIIFFGSVLILWICINTLVLIAHPFDPYPFILLNLVLSCIAALQAPVIMMSQNRQEQKDRQRAEHDYLINLRAEMEIRNLQVNMKNLFEIQKKQMDKLEEIRQTMAKKP
ncbi:MAG: DUF1003 domain-containing protein [Chitinophagales bacterium]